MPASLGIQSVMTTCAFLPNGGMTTEPGPDEVAIGVAGAVDAGPPRSNAGGGGELHAATGITAGQAAAGSRRGVIRLRVPRGGGARRGAARVSVPFAASPHPTRPLRRSLRPPRA